MWSSVFCNCHIIVIVRSVRIRLPFSLCLLNRFVFFAWSLIFLRSNLPFRSCYYLLVLPGIYVQVSSFVFRRKNKVCLTVFPSIPLLNSLYCTLLFDFVVREKSLPVRYVMSILSYYNNEKFHADFIVVYYFFPEFCVGCWSKDFWIQ